MHTMFYWPEAFIFGVLGLVIGSFLNVFILRHGVRSLGGRSSCMHCGRTLTWQDLFPVFSWLLLKGRCRTCKSPISAQYPVVEASTALLFGLVGGAPIAFVVQILSLPILCLLIAITVYDYQHTIIPDEWSYAFALCALGISFVAAWPILTQQWVIAELCAGPVTALPLFCFWLFSKGRWMGLGDAKLSLGIGWVLGFPYGLVSLFFSFILGAIVSLGILIPLPYVLRFLKKRGITSLRARSLPLTMKSEVPFGPFLIASCLIIWFMMIYGIPIGLISFVGL